MGIMTTISVIIIAIIFITIIGFGAQGRSELYHILRSKLFQTLSNRTPDAWKGAQPTATTVGRGRGEPTPQGTTGGRGDTMGWGGRGGLAALHHIFMRIWGLKLRFQNRFRTVATVSRVILALQVLTELSGSASKQYCEDSAFLDGAYFETKY